MGETRNSALLISQSVCAMIEAMGMQAENKQREALGQSMAYAEKDFQAIIERSVIGWNAAITLLNS